MQMRVYSISYQKFCWLSPDEALSSRQLKVLLLPVDDVLQPGEEGPHREDGQTVGDWAGTVVEHQVVGVEGEEALIGKV